MLHYSMALLVAGIVLVGCREETNPYKGNYFQKASNGSNGDLAGDQTLSVGDPNGAGNSDQNQPLSTTPLQSPPADTKTIPPAALTGIQAACASKAIPAPFEADRALLCAADKPTTLFVNLLASAYNGTGKPAVQKLKSTSSNNISDFIFATAFEVPLDLKATLGKQSAMDNMSFTEGNTTFVRTPGSPIPSTGGADLGGTVLRETVTVQVFITVKDLRILEARTTMIQEGAVALNIVNLKPNEADNNDNPLANILTFVVNEGTKTKYVTIAHQKVNNQGQASTADAVASNVATRLVVESYKKFQN